jgi:membrane protein
LPGGVSLLLSVLEAALLATGFAALFRYVPNTHVRWRHAVAGGLFSAGGFELAKKLLGWYLQQVPTYTFVYGAFATVPILLIWIYLAWVIVLLGAVVAAYAPSLRQGVKRWPDGPGARLQLGLAVMRELRSAQAQSLRGLSAARLAELLRIDPLQTEPLLESLMGFDWVGALDEPDDPRYVLLCDPVTTPARPLLAEFLIDPASAPPGLWQRAGFDTLTLQDLLQS